MKTTRVILALFVLAGLVSAGSESFGLRHRHGRRAAHKHHKKHAELPAQKRSVQCPFPDNMGLVAITPNEQNAGWAMSPNQPCLPGNWCPIACPTGQVMNQWNPAATSYTYPLSMDGGLYCQEDGTMQVPYPERPYCVDGVGNIQAVNECGEQVSFCQTILPGNEAMLIPNLVPGSGALTLAVPNASYWCSTSAEYFINIPGYGTEEACVWGDASKPIGNWAPFVGGANMASNGVTYVTVGINPIYCCEPSNGYSNVDPGFAIRIDCPSGNCNGMPCECNPATMGVNKCTGGTVGAGGAEFCVVTVPPGETANIVVFSTSGNFAGNGSSITSTQANVAPPPAEPPASASAASPSCSSSSSVAAPASSAWGSSWEASSSSMPSWSSWEYNASQASVWAWSSPSASAESWEGEESYPSNSLELQAQPASTGSISPVNNISYSTPSPSIQVVSTSDSDRVTFRLMTVSLVLVALGMINL